MITLVSNANSVRELGAEAGRGETSQHAKTRH